MNTLYGLTAEQVTRLSRLLYLVDSGELSLPRPSGSQRDLRADRVIVGLLDSSIAAVATLTGAPVPGTMSVYSFSSTGSVDTTRDETVYNFAPQAATTDRWCVAERDNITGKWVLTTQYCS